MKLLYLTEYFPNENSRVLTGGVESRTFYVARYLKSHHHKVTVERRTENYAFNYFYTLVDRIAYIVTQLFHLMKIKRQKYDLVEGTNFVTYIPAFFRAKRIGAKAIAWYPDVFSGESIKRLGYVNGLVVELMERIALKLPWDGIIALSKETKKKLISRGIKEKKIHVIYGGVTNARFSINKYLQATLLCVSRLVSYKRVEDLLLAFYVLQKEFPFLKIIIVGDGPIKSTLQKLSRQLGIQSNIEWKKRINEEEKFELFARSRLHILPSVVEGFGLVTIESLACGTPVINTDIPINREILEGGRGGLLYRAGDYISLSEKIERMLKDKTLYNQKVQEGLELAKKYDFNIVNRQAEAFYQRLLSHRY